MRRGSPAGATRSVKRWTVRVSSCAGLSSLSGDNSGASPTAGPRSAGPFPGARCRGGCDGAPGGGLRPGGVVQRVGAGVAPVAVEAVAAVRRAGAAKSKIAVGHHQRGLAGERLGGRGLQPRVRDKLRVVAGRRRRRRCARPASREQRLGRAHDDREARRPAGSGAGRRRRGRRRPRARAGPRSRRNAAPSGQRAAGDPDVDSGMDELPEGGEGVGVLAPNGRRRSPTRLDLHVVEASPSR